MEKLQKKKKFRYHSRGNIDSRSINFTYMLPNIITLIALACGVTALRFAFGEKWELAVTLIFFSSLFDVLDGAIARALRVTSEFGAQLDSLADCVSFGIAPGFIMYAWDLKHFGFFGWSSTIIYILCIVIRLARFNSDLSLNVVKYEWQKGFFKGIPSPAAGALLMLPLIIELSDINVRNINSSPYIICYTILIGLLAVSKIPTISLKKIKVKREFFSFVMVCLGCTTILLITYPWIVIPMMLICYLFSIPHSVYKYRKLMKNENLLDSSLFKL